jgi:AbrB family looped-hinge helix DNA binding protein
VRTTIDRSGRLVVPLGMRSQLGLTDGGEVEVEVVGAAIVIEPVAGDDLQTEAGFIVIPAIGDPVTDADVRSQRLAEQR